MEALKFIFGVLTWLALDMTQGSTILEIFKKYFISQSERTYLICYWNLDHRSHESRFCQIKQ